MPKAATDAPAQGAPEDVSTTPAKTQATPAAPVADDDLPLVDPRELRTGKAMPTKAHVFRLPTGERKKVLLQGLTYTEKAEVDYWSRERAASDVKEGTKRPSMWGPVIVAASMRRPDGSRNFQELGQAVAQGLALAEQMADGEIQKAVKVVLDISGYSDDSLDAAVKV
jgi:hypothetical protein